MAEEGKSSSGVRVCITGGAVFIGSWLMRKLLEKCYIVHATLRNTGGGGGRIWGGGGVGSWAAGEAGAAAQGAGEARGGVRGAGEAGVAARRGEGRAAAAEQLRLFEADLVGAATFAPAIAGCQFVFLVATPYGLEAASSKYKSTAEAAVDAVRAILRQCEESKTVRRVIHIASLAAASQLKEPDAGAGAYKDFISESCWTPFNVDYPLRSAHFDKYILSKLQSEQELLSYNAGESPAFEAVTLPLGLVAGDTVLRRAPETLEHAVSPVSRNELGFAFLRLLQRLLGSLPLVHVDDACDALVFCMERRASIAGRFLCAAAYPTSHDVAGHFASKFPHLDILEETEAVVVRAQRAEDKLGGDS
ncbi:hypothetical protein SETIT_4G195700v2 [Setaria italica]|uniref:NAD-dependent epimerase/dehydratase domain-containing protein n=1 Tax=Setaria italica TaxID=4555 RepID=A0A368QWG0_SETIT|nr:hypothetical protein SETIT_4G195700v2 [Setaria italica]